ncbi:MAG: formyltetrahydrofolate deformylase [Gammaproteobacteria bacterium]|nr:formyltetrahydrofolate deformylase [Gammaproteobacteria bacterium]
MKHVQNATQTAALLVHCEDQSGIMSAVAQFFADHKLNLIRQEGFIDAGRMYCRLEWELDERWEDAAALEAEFATSAAPYDAQFSARFFDREQTIGIMVSTKTHALTAVLNRTEDDYFPAVDVSFILGDDADLQHTADRHGTPFFHVSTDGDRLQAEQQQLEIIQRYKPDYLALARYDKVLSANMLGQLDCPVINIHHTFMPAFMGGAPYSQAYERGVKLLGATSAYVTAELDQGPIIEQDVARVPSGTSVAQMITQGERVERRVFTRALQKVLQHKTIVHDNRTIIFN